MGPRKKRTRQKRTPEQIRATAYHEAGHAVVHVAMGLVNNKVSIIPGKDYNGVCHAPNVLGYYETHKSKRRAIGRALIIGCYAGLHAQQLVDAAPEEYHGASDDSLALELSRTWGVLPRGCSYVGDDEH
jgi:ATP-dependent Zn protease